MDFSPIRATKAYLHRAEVKEARETLKKIDKDIKELKTKIGDEWYKGVKELGERENFFLGKTADDLKAFNPPIIRKDYERETSKMEKEYNEKMESLRSQLADLESQKVDLHNRIKKYSR